MKRVQAEIPCPLCGRTMKQDRSGGVVTCQNKGKECGNYRVSYRIPRMVQEPIEDR